MLQNNLRMLKKEKTAATKAALSALRHGVERKKFCKKESYYMSLHIHIHIFVMWSWNGKGRRGGRFISAFFCLFIYFMFTLYFAPWIVWKVNIMLKNSTYCKTSKRRSFELSLLFITVYVYDWHHCTIMNLLHHTLYDLCVCNNGSTGEGPHIG